VATTVVEEIKGLKIGVQTKVVTSILIPKFRRCKSFLTEDRLFKKIL